MECSFNGKLNLYKYCMQKCLFSCSIIIYNIKISYKMLYRLNHFRHISLEMLWLDVNLNYAPNFLTNIYSTFAILNRLRKGWMNFRIIILKLKLLVFKLFYILNFIEANCILKYRKIPKYFHDKFCYKIWKYKMIFKLYVSFLLISNNFWKQVTIFSV